MPLRDDISFDGSILITFEEMPDKYAVVVPRNVPVSTHVAFFAAYSARTRCLIDCGAGPRKRFLGYVISCLALYSHSYSLIGKILANVFITWAPKLAV